MTTAYWCVLISILFPYIFTVLAKLNKNFDNHDPRACLDRVTGWKRRAHCVQLNSFEIIPAFGLAVIIAELAKAPQSTLDIIAIVFIITRVCYAICYLTDKAGLRSLFWGIGMACILSLFYIAA